MKQRIDIFLVAKGIVSSRMRAKEIIEKGLVLYNGEVVKRPSQSVDTEMGEVEVLPHKKFVGRGAIKLKETLDYFKINPKGLVAIDIGASTGGFTQILLEKDVQKVFCIDVGTGQLAKKIRDNDRVVNIEGHNMRFGPPPGVEGDLAVVDVSHISLRLILEAMFESLKTEGIAVILFKPQFEVGPKQIGKKGVVKREYHEEAKKTFTIGF